MSEQEYDVATRLLCEWFVVCGCTFLTSDAASFRRFLKNIAPAFEKRLPKHLRKLMRRLLPELYDDTAI